MLRIRRGLVQKRQVPASQTCYLRQPLHGSFDIQRLHCLESFFPKYVFYFIYSSIVFNREVGRRLSSIDFNNHGMKHINVSYLAGLSFVIQRNPPGWTCLNQQYYDEEHSGRR